jgi:DegV family protein with EDD domain
VAAFDVDCIKFSFTMSDGEHLDDLGVSMSSHEFYERMRKGEEPKTAQVPYAHIRRSLEAAMQSGVPTVYLCFTAALSGTFDVASLVAHDLQAMYPDNELYVVDTKLPSVAEGLLVKEAIRQLDRGLTAQEMCTWVEDARYYVHGYFTLPNLESLRRGGRIPDVAALAGSKLDIKPILSYDLEGGLSLHSVARGRKKALKQIVQLFSERRHDNDLDTVIVASADTYDEQQEVVRQVQELTHNKVAIEQAQIGPVIGSHVGPGMLALVFWGADRRKAMSLSDRIAHAVGGHSTK